MTRTLTILLIFLGTFAFGQSVQIDTFNLKKSERFRTIKTNEMNFPLIRTGDEKTDSLINTDLKNRFTGNEYLNEPLNSTLKKWAGDQIIYLDFEVTYNQNGILSLNISAEGCGAYCSFWTDYFNYSTTSGKILDISEIIDTTGGFTAKVYKDKELQYTQQEKELKEILSDPGSGLDQSSYEWSLKYYIDCENSFNLKTFAIYPDRLEIIERCYLPNAIKNLTPVINLSYKISEIEDYLKIKI